MYLGEIFLILITLISLYFLIQILRGKLKLKSRTDTSSIGGGTGDTCFSDCSGGDGGT